jgi:hypothetical protein
MNEGLLKNIKMTVVHDYPANSTGATGTTGTNYVDMAGYDNVLLLFVPTEAIATAINTIYPVFSTDYSGSTFHGATSQYAGTTSATTAMEQMLWAVDVIKPRERYVSVYNYKLTAASGGVCVAIQYNGAKLPVAQSTALYGVVHGTQFASQATTS